MSTVPVTLRMVKTLAWPPMAKSVFERNGARN